MTGILKVGRLELDEIKSLGSLLCEETGSAHRIKPGFCLSCGAYRDLEPSKVAVKKAEICIRRYGQNYHFFVHFIEFYR